MEAIFTLNNIHDLLASKYVKGFEWNYQIYDRKNGKKKLATIEDFEDSSRAVALVIDYKDDEYSLDVAVSDFSFMVFEDEPNIMGSGSTTHLRDNFTNDWITLLLNEHKDEYAKRLLRYSKNNIDRIKKNADEDIAEYINKVHEKVKKQSFHFEHLAEQAKQHLPLLDIVEIERYE